MKFFFLGLALCAAVAFGQTTVTETVNLSYTVPATTVTVPSQVVTVPVSVTVTPTQVTIGSTVIPVPVAGTTAPPVTTPPVTTGSNDLKVIGSKILNPDGTEFRIRGVDICHYDSSWSNLTDGVGNSGANAIRIFMPLSAASMATYINDAWSMKIVPIATIAGVPPSGSTATSGDNSTADLASVVAAWVSYAPTLKSMHPLIINIANEWLSGANPSVWQSSYISAITQLRAAGYTQIVMIDTDGYGQDYGTLETNAAAVLAADPLKNVTFSYHLYGNTPSVSAMQTDFAALAKTGLSINIMEFGPGNNIGPSPTEITPAQVVAAAEANGFGYAAWAFDDNNLAGAAANDSWFSMTTGGTVNGVYHGVGYYDGVTQSQLTLYGQQMVPVLKSTAIKSTMFK